LLDACAGDQTDGEEPHGDYGLAIAH